MTSKEKREYLLNLFKDGIRFDGRKLDEFRKEIIVEKGIISTAEGSARVRLGNTEVLAGIKLEINQPYPDTPDEGGIVVNVILPPLASPEFEFGSFLTPTGIKAVEYSRVVDRALRESKAIDLKKLVIKKGEKAWFINIDCVVLNDAGNIIDAATLAAINALIDARFPFFDNDKVDYKKKTEKKLPIRKKPLNVTVYKLGKYFFVDPIKDEEEVYDARLTVASTEDGNICALQKGGDVPLSQEEILTMIDIALKKTIELRRYVL